MDSGQRLMHSAFALSRSKNPVVEEPVFPRGDVHRLGPSPYHVSSENTTRSRKNKPAPSMRLNREDSGSWRFSPIQSTESASVFRPPAHANPPFAQQEKRKHYSLPAADGSHYGGMSSSFSSESPYGYHHQPAYSGGHHHPSVTSLSPFHPLSTERALPFDLSNPYASRPLPSGSGVRGHHLLPVAKPKARKSKHNESFHKSAPQLFPMPPPIRNFVPGMTKDSADKMKPPEKIRKKPGPKPGSKAVVNVPIIKVDGRWKAVEDTHHTRLMDLIKLKPGEEAEFEEELSLNLTRGNKLKTHSAGRSMKKEIKRLSSLRSGRREEFGIKPDSPASDGDVNGGQGVKVIAKVRVGAAPEERYRRPIMSNPDSEIFEQYYSAKKRIQTTLKRAKPLTMMRRSPTSKLSAVLSRKKDESSGHHQALFSPLGINYPASDWGRAAFMPAGKLARSPRLTDEYDILGSLPSVSSTPSYANSDTQLSESDADENRKKILVQLQKLNDKRARLEAQLTKIQRNSGAPVQPPGPSAYEPTNLPTLHAKPARPPPESFPGVNVVEVVPPRPPPPPRDYVREQWKIIAMKFVPMAVRMRNIRKAEARNCRAKINAACLREHADNRLESERLAMEYVQRCKFLVRDMFARWKVIDKEERKYKRLQERQEVEQKRIDLEMQEARRQQRKLNFLLTQTELYAHFMGKKISGTADADPVADPSAILQKLEEAENDSEQKEESEEPDPTTLLVGTKGKEEAVKNVTQAVEINRKRMANFNEDAGIAIEAAGMKLSDDKILSEPVMFDGELKGYQKKGVSWLASLFSNGINGILADEMGLGKTVQSIAFLAHVAEEYGIWGPFLIVAPASTLHNWQQEFHRFVPKFKVVPYWGTADERKILRQFWKADKMHTEQASFHVVVTSYQLVVQDAPYLKKLNWQYMILDEAQAIKSSTSIRWKLLLDFPCRNRLLLTGTPIQNSMAELWALLHFIMPSLFDSHLEFSEWFSRDIESHAENKSQIDEKHLSRLHMILKPFMMRRIKRDVEEELSDKIEIMMHCPLTRRQQMLYEALKHKISIDDLLYSSCSSVTASSESTSTLLNLVMQFRKVCNHPELFERRDVRSPVFSGGIECSVPKLVYNDCVRQDDLAAKQSIIHKYFLLSSPANVRHTRVEKEQSKGPLSSILSFCRFYPVDECDIEKTFRLGYAHLLTARDKLESVRSTSLMKDVFGSEKTRSVSAPSLLLDPFLALSPSKTSEIFPHLIVWNAEIHRYAYGHCRIHHIADSTDQKTQKPVEQPEAETFSAGDDSQAEAEVEEPRQPRLIDTYPLCLPRFFTCYVPKALCKPSFMYCYDRHAESDQQLLSLRNSSNDSRELLLYGSKREAELYRKNRFVFKPAKIGGLFGVREEMVWSPLEIPDKQHLVVDSGKLRVLDSLLHRLKDEGHRVLIYCLMTKMMDILEEFMVFKRYPYIRLDGSSKIAERRDMVHDFQSRDDIFVFLLSTRAGGLGINLTAADTVVFYDSDWNPTVDQQAMDRAHRLGQTKQVTVYRLICRNTVEERILQRAQEKSEIQRMVISGGDYRPDTLRPTEVVSLLLDDEEIRSRLRQRESEGRPKETGQKKSASKSKASKPKTDSTKSKKKSSSKRKIADVNADAADSGSKIKKKKATSATGTSVGNTETSTPEPATSSTSNKKSKSKVSKKPNAVPVPSESELGNTEVHQGKDDDLLGTEVAATSSQSAASVEASIPAPDVKVSAKKAKSKKSKAEKSVTQDTPKKGAKRSRDMADSALETVRTETVNSSVETNGKHAANHKK
ncbi:chromatin-remodeling ATPase INO80-like [Paramacrobiotus metropolitanus]|uniref:chromatin-remodeling ATPase INO80-like n=1 Tax=Paramacrobiotus metropolitanus TaxID=2943436 RepID=UPI0024462F12|nr:chromatin-remodeling ATPase INO80-like [Paramacrobiotus metropolitanus]